MTTKAPSAKRFQATSDTLGILLAGYIEQEHDSARFGWDRVSGVLCVWPLSALGVDDPALES